MGIVFLLGGWALLMCKGLSQQRINQSVTSHETTTRQQTLYIQSPHTISIQVLMIDLTDNHNE